MILTIKYSRTKSIEIDIEQKALLVELMRQSYEYDDDFRANSITLDEYAASTLLLSQNQWLEDHKCLSDYAIGGGQVIDLISLRFGAEDAGPDQRHIPEEFICPLSGAVFYQPMLLPSGVSVEKQSIERWLSEHTKCPFTNDALSSEKLIENHQIKEKLDRLVKKYVILQDVIGENQYQNQILVRQPYTPGPTVPDANDRWAIARASGFNSYVTSDLDVSFHFLRDERQFTWERHNSSLIFAIISLLIAESPQLNHRERLRGTFPRMEHRPTADSDNQNADTSNAIISQATPHLTASFLLMVWALIQPTQHAATGYIRFLNFFRSSRSDFRAIVQRNLQETIAALQNYGVTEALIRQHWLSAEPLSDWLEYEKNTLIYLITGIRPIRGYSIESIPPLPTELYLNPIAALREITQLDSMALVALQHWYSTGLRGDLLRQWRDDEGINLFMQGHLNALDYLVGEQNMGITEAMERIHGLSDSDAWSISFGPQAVG